jgi:hypothetical protein
MIRRGPGIDQGLCFQAIIFLFCHASKNPTLTSAYASPGLAREFVGHRLSE